MLATFRDPRAYRALLFFVTALPFAVLEFALLLGGWLVTVLLAITPLVIPVLIAFGVLVRAVGRAEGVLARALLGAWAGTPRPPRATGFWRRGWVVLTDPWFWRAQAYFLLRVFGGGALAVALLTIVAAALGLVAAPVAYHWIPQDDGWHGYDLGVWHADRLWEALLLVPLGAGLLLATLTLLRPLAALWRAAADALLGTSSGATGAVPALRFRRRELAVHAGVAGGIVALLVAIWALTGRSDHWPVWVAIPLALLVVVHAWLVLLEERPSLWRRGLTRPLAALLGVSVALELFFVAVWAAGGAGYFWPAWTLLALGGAAGIHAAIVLARRDESRRLAERVERLETSRAGAVDVQEADLRRIERDLHDGAQARLVALGMSIGMAEQKLQADPDAARELMAEARVGVGEALRELRDLARGIRPPVLADRGLGAAIEALADGSPLPVRVTADVDPRPADSVETAAYFVSAEALANAAKHARATRVDVRLERCGDVLVVEVADDGVGGADPAGGGLGGLRRRVDALDGSLTVTSPPGGPTVVRAELPCGS